MATTITTKPMFRAGECLPLAFATKTIGLSADAVAGTVLMYDSTAEKYKVADTGTIGIITAVTFFEEGVSVNSATEGTLTNTKGWCVLAEDAVAAATSAKVLMSGVIDDDDLTFAGSTLDALTEEAKVILKMNGIDVSQSKTN